VYVQFGLSFAKQWSNEKLVEHYAIIDHHNSLRTLRGWGAVVLELIPGGLRIRQLQSDESWEQVPIADQTGARTRLLNSLRSPLRSHYVALSNNCEHWARSIAFGESRSEQVKGLALVAGLAFALYLVSRKAA
jgi:hypothetical protein